MKEKIKKLKKEVKGITLVALVVTIIVLLILAGVAITLTLGDEGIFRRAQEGTQIYENASQNEKIEIDKVSNYIDNLNEIQNMSEVEKAIKNGTVYQTNTTIYDEYNNPVKVPAGFKLAEDSGTDVTKGVVIEDVSAGDSNTKGNQYVWVPIGNVKTDTNGTITAINFGRYSFDVWYNSETAQIEGTGVAIMRQSADNYTSTVTIDTYYQELENSSYGNTVAKNLGDFITKAKNAGGYYIGRYEAGKVSGNTNTFNIKKRQAVYNSITQPNAANLARNLYSSNNNFESDLINSYAYDTAIVFIQAFSGDTDYSKQTPLQTSLTTTGNAHNEENSYDIRCNIYDIAGNVREWSTETCTYSNTLCMSRSVDCYDSRNSAASRGFFYTSDSAVHIGFRSILYVK